MTEFNLKKRLIDLANAARFLDMRSLESEILAESMREEPDYGVYNDARAVVVAGLVGHQYAVKRILDDLHA
jgi:hypothetical protein